MLVSGFHVTEEHGPIEEVDIPDFQVDQRGRTAPGPQQKVDYDPIAVLGKGAGLLVRRFKQALQFGAGVGFFDGIVCPYQLDGKALQIPFVHAPVQESPDHAEIGVDGRIVKSLLFQVENIIYNGLFCDAINGLVSVLKKVEEASRF